MSGSGDFFNRLNRTFVTDRLLEGSLNDARQRAKVLVMVLAISAMSGCFLVLALGTTYLINRDPLFLAATMMAVISVAG